MIFDIESGTFKEIEKTKELFILSTSLSGCQSYTTDLTVYNSSDRYVISKIVFFDGYIRCMEGSSEVTGVYSDWWFVEAIDSQCEYYQTSTSTSQPFTVGEVSGTYFASNSVHSYKTNNLCELKKTIIHLSEKNGIKTTQYQKDELSFNDLLMIMSYPLIRNNYVKGMSLNNIKAKRSIEGHMVSNNSFFYDIPKKPSDGFDFLRCKDLKSSIKLCMNGGFSKGIIKEVIKRGIITKKYKKLIIDKHIKEEDLNDIVSKTNRGNKILGFDKMDNSFVATKLEFCVEILKVIEFFSGEIEVDHIQKLLEEGGLDQKTIPPSVLVLKKQILNLYPQKRVMKLFSQKETDMSLISDICSQYNKYKNPESIPKKLKRKYPNGLTLPKKPKTWKEVHDKVSKSFNEIKQEEIDIPYEYTEEEWSLHGFKKENIEFKLASSGGTVVKWGTKMKNCIASYADKNTKKHILLGVHVNGKLQYNARLVKPSVAIFNKTRTWRLYECRSYENGKTEPKHLSAIEDMVDEIFPLRGIKP